MARSLALWLALALGIASGAQSAPPDASDFRGELFLSHGQIAYRLGDYQKALVNFLKAAQLDNKNAQYIVGLMYSKGQGVSRDYGEAAQWYRRAADQDHPGAQTNLGFIYANGLGVERNFKEAAYWYDRAADQGEIKAQGYLAFMYEVGQGIPRDPVQAHKWFSILLANGPAADRRNAERVIALLESRMSPAEIDRAYKLAEAWLAESLASR